MNRILPISLKNHWVEPKDLIQIFSGPRQVGKTTAVLSLMDPNVSIYASADLPTPPTGDFIVENWKKARTINSVERTLILDEVQKIPRWSDVVKSLWDEDRKDKLPMRVCLLGSSAILIEKGLSESLMGRFEMNYFPHWTYEECSRCFNATLEEYILIGGYPKSYDLRNDKERLESYLQNSILEPTLGRDILSLHSVDKPALLRQLFWYVARLPAQIVSYEKILGHLQGRGNSATLVQYAELLTKAFLICPLSKFSQKVHRTKRSIPKWIIPNPGLVEHSLKGLGPKDSVFENLVGSHMLNLMFGNKEYELQFYREDNFEVDFVLTRMNQPIFAIEVKSGRLKKIPTKETLVRKGIDCPLKIITRANVLEFLKTTSVDEMQSYLSQQ